VLLRRFNKGNNYHKEFLSKHLPDQFSHFQPRRKEFLPHTYTPPVKAYYTLSALPNQAAGAILFFGANFRKTCRLRLESIGPGRCGGTPPAQYGADTLHNTMQALRTGRCKAFDPAW
jgi:hypothetical protein